MATISIHAPYKRVRPANVSNNWSSKSISIHAPYKRVRRHLHQINCPASLFQSTHPTRECDYYSIITADVRYDISIHAPYKRVRHRCPYERYQRMAISIHAPYKRVRPQFDITYTDFKRISIHAPYKRVRLKQRLFWMHLNWFQSTHPTRECDLKQLVPSVCWQHFNPRTLQESATMVSIAIIAAWQLFQSTHPTRECDQKVTYADFSDQVFQSTHPTRECDEAYLPSIQAGKISIHAPYKRVRLSGFYTNANTALISIHAPYKRVRPQHSFAWSGHRYFNPRTLQESATL